MARTISAGGVSLSRKPGGAGAQRAQHELVGVEGRQHDDGRRVGLGAQQAGGGDAVELRHADVHEHDVGPVAVDGAQHAAPVVGLADDLDALRAGQHHPQPRAHERVVVDEQDADGRAHAGHGRVARRTKSPAASGPCSSSPPASATRSASPTRPVPAPGSASGAGAATPTARRLTTSTHERRARLGRDRRPPPRRPARACARWSGPPGRCDVPHLLRARRDAAVGRARRHPRLPRHASRRGRGRRQPGLRHPRGLRGGRRRRRAGALRVHRRPRATTGRRCAR